MSKSKKMGYVLYVEERNDIVLNEAHMFFFDDIENTIKGIAEVNLHEFF